MAHLHDETALLEDATWLAETGVGMTEAATRLDFTDAKTLEKYLHRHGRYDLAHRLQANDPKPVA